MELFVAECLQRDEIILIRGNHEDLLIDFVDKLPTYALVGFEYTHHYSNGTVNTVKELIGSTLKEMKNHPEETIAKVKLYFRQCETTTKRKIIFSYTVGYRP